MIPSPDALRPVVTPAQLLGMQASVREVHVEEDVGKYILRLADATRRHPDLALGASPRASLALFRAAQARAFLDGKDFAGPAEVQAVFGPVLTHRVMLTTKARYGGKSASDIASAVLETVEVPT